MSEQCELGLWLKQAARRMRWIKPGDRERRLKALTELWQRWQAQAEQAAWEQRVDLASRD